MWTGKRFDPGGLETLMEQLAHMWAQAHGASEGTPHYMVGPDSFAIYFEHTLNPAERTLAEQTLGARVLNPYLESLLDQVCADFCPQVEAALERRISGIYTAINPASELAFCIFMLE